jgi:hypothetical protein
LIEANTYAGFERPAVTRSGAVDDLVRPLGECRRSDVKCKSPAFGRAICKYE